MRAVLLSLLVAVTAAATSAGEPEVTADQLAGFPVEATLIAATERMRWAEDRTEAQAWSAAAELFQLALARGDATARDKANAAFGLAACHLEAGAPLDLTQFSQLVAPDDAPLRSDLAARLLRNERLDDCLAVLGTFDLLPHPRALFLYATAVNDSDPQRALALFSVFATRYPNDANAAAAEFSAARAALRTAEFAVAEDWFTRVRNKEIPGVHRAEQTMGLAEALFRQDKFAAAQPLFESLCEVDFEQVDLCRLRLAQCLAGQENYQAAVDLARSVSGEQLRSQAQQLAIRWQLLDGQELDSERLTAGAEGLVLINVFQIGERLLRRGAAEARRQFEQAADAPAASGLLRESALSRAAYCCYELEDWQACCGHIDTVLQQFPECSHAGRLLLLKTLAQSRWGKSSLSEESLSRALAAEPQPDRRRSFLMQAARQFAVDQALDLAARTYETVVYEYDPQFARPIAEVLDAIDQAVAIRDQLNQPKSSIQLLQQALALRENLDQRRRSQLTFRLAARLQTAGRQEEALEQFRLLSHDAELGPQALLKIAAILDSTGRTKEAARTYYYLLTRHPRSHAAEEARVLLTRYINQLKRRQTV